MQETKTSDWVINPVFVFLSLWLTQIIGHIVFFDSFDSFVINTWWIIGAGIFAFLGGSIVASFLATERNSSIFSDVCTVPLLISIVLRWLLPVYALTVAFPQVMAFISNPDVSFAEIRGGLIDSVVANDRGVILISYLHYLIVLSCLLSLCYASGFSKKIIWYIVVSGLLAGLLTLGRNVLLLYFISLGVILYLQNLISKKSALAIGVFFVVIFFLIASVLGKGDAEGGWFENILWNFKVYILGGVAAFNNYVEYGELDDLGGLLLPNFIKELLSIFGVDMTSTPNFFPFVETPLPVNVYTAFFPWYHDAGIFGVLFGFFVIGFLSTRLFKARRRSRVSLFIYSISLYPLLMMIFEEQYLRAYTLWVLAFFLIIALGVIEKFKVNEIFG